MATNKDVVSTVLVTGASGFIGTHVVKQLLEQDQQVRATVQSLQNKKKVESLHALSSEGTGNLEVREANLLDDECWPDVVAGCSHVIHLAGPVPDELPQDENEVIRPNVDGTLRVLRACAKSGTVKRVVLTSSVKAITDGLETRKKPYDESDWANVSKAGTTAYTKAKTLAETAAWDFLKDLPVEEQFEMAVLNPTMVLGPALCEEPTTSMSPIIKLMQNGMPMLAKLCFPIIDVRDVAAIHILALTHPTAVGKRCLLYNDNYWLADIAKICREEFTQHGYQIPQKVAPNFLLKMASVMDKTLLMVLPSLSVDAKYDNSRMIQEFGIQPRDIRDTIIDMVYSLIEKDIIKKTQMYKGRQ